MACSFHPVKRLAALAFSMGLAMGGVASAAPEYVSGGKLLLTGGVSTIEGSAGGGLSTWALIGGQETRDGVGAAAFATYVPLPNYSLTDMGVAVGVFDRLELSYAHQEFDTGQTGARLGLGKGFSFDQDVVGAKLRLFGDAVYDQDQWTPQVAVGLQVKANDQAAILRAIGAKSADGVDFYVSATKLLLAQSLVLSGTVRLTKANQTGLLGFGGDRDNDYSPQFEGSAGYLVTRHLAVGAEYRTKPDNLGFAKESDWADLFAAYAFCPHLSATLAYADLGPIATFRNQRGVYVSLQAGF